MKVRKLMLEALRMADPDEDPQCYVCLRPFELGQEIGPHDATAGLRAIVVHAQCSGKPLQRQPTEEERAKGKAAMDELRRRYADPNLN